MKIISNFKDYYDHQAHIYGGGDPKIIYRRLNIPEDKAHINLDSAGIKTKNFKLPCPYTHAYDQFAGQSRSDGFKWLIVCGKLFMLVATRKGGYDGYPTPEGPYEIFDIEKHSHLVREKQTSLFKKKNILPTTFVENSDFVTLSKAVDQPVFVIEYHGYDYNAPTAHLHINPNIPNLGDLGLASFIPPEQLYQDLSYFIVNTMKDSPDTMPPSPMTDKEKVLSHGFDLKQSFRHRK